MQDLSQRQMLNPLSHPGALSRASYLHLSPQVRLRLHPSLHLYEEMRGNSVHATPNTQPSLPEHRHSGGFRAALALMRSSSGERWASDTAESRASKYTGRSPVTNRASSWKTCIYVCLDSLHSTFNPVIEHLCSLPAWPRGGRASPLSGARPRSFP